MRERPFAFICSPFRGDVKNNIKMARGYCLQVFNEGYAPVAPHLLFPQFLDDAIPYEREASMEMGLSLLRQCRIMSVCGDEVTKGMVQEIFEAKRQRVAQKQCHAAFGDRPAGEHLRTYLSAG